MFQGREDVPALFFAAGGAAVELATFGLAAGVDLLDQLKTVAGGRLDIAVLGIAAAAAVIAGATIGGATAGDHLTGAEIMAQGIGGLLRGDALLAANGAGIQTIAVGGAGGVGAFRQDVVMDVVRRFRGRHRGQRGHRRLPDCPAAWPF